MKTIFISQASLEHNLIEIDCRLSGEPSLEAECPYFEKCKLVRKGKIDCTNDEAIQNCQSYKFYERYPNYEQMFVGSKI